MKHLKAIFVFLLVPFAACQVPNDFQPVPTPQVKDTDACDLAGQHLEEMNCKEATPTKQGKRFAQFCKETQAAGIFINPVCLSKITNCNQVNCCTNTESCSVPQ